MLPEFQAINDALEAARRDFARRNDEVRRVVLKRCELLRQAHMDRLGRPNPFLPSGPAGQSPLTHLPANSSDGPGRSTCKPPAADRRPSLFSLCGPRR